MNSNVLQTLALMITFSICIGDEKLLIQEPKHDDIWSWNVSGGWGTVSFPETLKNCHPDVSIIDTVVSPFSKLPDTPVQAKAVSIEVAFTVRNCSSFSSNIPFCNETFGLYMIEQDQESPKPKPNNFTKLVATLRAAPGEMTNNEPEEEIKSKVLLRVAITRRGLYFAFRQKNACTAIFSFKVYYNWCPSYKGKFEDFPKVASPATGSVSVRGRCSLHAVSKLGTKTVKAFCDSNGKWQLTPSSTCVCQAGYQLAADGNKCKECPIGTYKSKSGNLKCTRCPANSSPDSTKTRCDCKTGYYRAPLEPDSANCTTIPSAPRNLSISFLNGNSFKVSWESPIRLGGRDDVFYDINCLRLQKNTQSWDNCNRRVRYHPKSTGLKIKAVVVTNLQEDSLYQFRVLAKNGVTSVAKGLVNFAEVNVTTGRKIESLTCQLCDSFSGSCNTTTHITCPREDSAACYHGYVTSSDSNGTVTVHQVKGCTKYNESNCSQQCVLLKQSAQTNFTECKVTCCSGDLCNTGNDTISTMKPTSYHSTREAPSTTTGRNITSVASAPPAQSAINLIILTVLILMTVIPI